MLINTRTLSWAACLLHLSCAQITAQSPDAVSDSRDPFGAATQLNLDRLVTSVLERNPSIEAMEQTWRAAVERYPQAVAFDDPMLSYSAAPGTIDSSAFDYGQKIELSQKLPWPGKRRLRGEIEREKAAAANLDIATLELKLAEQTERAFFDYAYVHRAIEINDLNLDLLAEFQKIAESKYSTGEVTKQDALQAEVERNHLKHRAVSLERMRKAAQAQINTLLHRSPERPLPPPPGKLAAPAPKRPVATLLAQAVNRRPELKALAHRLRAAEAGHKLAHKERLPDFTVMGVYNSLWIGEERQGMIGVGINLPLNQKKRRAREAETLAQSQKLEAEFVAAVDRVKLEVIDAYDLLTESEHVVKLYREEFIPAAEANLEAARSAYETGEGDFLSLITAEKNLMLARLRHQRALADYHQRRAQLEAAIGDLLPPRNGPGPKNANQTPGGGN